jgi:Zn-finger nucleic acid-binding protein
MPPACPRCRKALSVVTKGSVAARRCGDCSGLFFGAGTFERYLDQLRLAGEVPPVESFKLDGSLGSHTREHPTLPCPQCGSPMQTVNYGYDSDIFLDRCGSCQGLWADGTEIIPAAQHLAGHPALRNIEAAWKSEFDSQAEALDSLDSMSQDQSERLQYVLRKAGMKRSTATAVTRALAIAAALSAIAYLVTILSP